MSKSTATALTLADRSYNKGIDHGGAVGVNVKLALNAAKRGGVSTATATTQYSGGFIKGFTLGWKAA